MLGLLGLLGSSTACDEGSAPEKIEGQRKAKQEAIAELPAELAPDKVCPHIIGIIAQATPPTEQQADTVLADCITVAKSERDANPKAYEIKARCVLAATTYKELAACEPEQG